MQLNLFRDFYQTFFFKNNSISKDITNALLAEVIKPITRKISTQRDLIKQINVDLNKTIDDQQSTRDFLILKTSDVNSLKEKYQELINSVSK